MSSSYHRSATAVGRVAREDEQTMLGTRCGGHRIRPDACARSVRHGKRADYIEEMSLCQMLRRSTPACSTQAAQVASWGMEKADVESLTEAERAWFLHSEELWRRAHVIAADHPGLDPGDVYHALRALELTPSERLRRGLTRVQRRPHTR